jgi:anti-sigma factor RsiW
MHVEEGRLQALLDGELDEVSAADARRHIDGCAECRGQLEELRRDEQLLASVLPSIDHPVPRMRAPRRRPLRWAAAIALFLLAAGTAYAIPGSPVRRFVDRLVGRPVGEEAPRSPEVAGVALPYGQRFSIMFSAPRAPGVLTITLTDGATIDARRRGGAATFTAEIDRLRIETASAPTDFEIAIPRDAPWVEILVGPRRIFLKDGSRVITEARADAEGRYIF